MEQSGAFLLAVIDGGFKLQQNFVDCLFVFAL